MFRIFTFLFLVLPIIFGITLISISYGVSDSACSSQEELKLYMLLQVLLSVRWQQDTNTYVYKRYASSFLLGDLRHYLLHIPPGTIEESPGDFVHL
jgi:hypothetical protein